MLLWAQSRESALFLADVISMQKGDNEFFVIGGADIFEMFQDLFNRVHMTEVFDDRRYEKERSAYFPYKFDQRKWHLVFEENIPAGPQDEFPSRFCVFERRDKTVRYVELDKYYTEADVKSQWISEKLKLVKAAPASVLEREIRDGEQYKMFVEHES
jgi:dihydrofolate reductase